MKVEVAVLAVPNSPYGLCGRKAAANCTTASYLPFGPPLNGGQRVATGGGLHAREPQPVNDDGVDNGHDGHGQPVQHHRHQRPVGALGRQALVTLAAACTSQ